MIDDGVIRPFIVWGTVRVWAEVPVWRGSTKIGRTGLEGMAEVADMTIHEYVKMIEANQ